MKRSWIILGLLLLLIVCVVVLFYILAQGMVTTLPMMLLALFLVLLILAVIGCILWLAFWMPQEKVAEAERPSAVVETSKAEPSYLTEEVKTKPVQKAVKEVAADRGLKVSDIEGIGPVNAAKLNSVDIYTTSDLLEAGATPVGRKELAGKVGVSEDLILEWVNRADLFRIKGVGEEYSDLLEASGVDTVVELAKRVPENLHAKILEVNARDKLVRRAPTLNEVRQWVEEAKTLPRKIQY